MTVVGTSNPLAAMLNNAFSKFDKDSNGNLDSQEFTSFNEILKPGIAYDKDGKPLRDMSQDMDHDKNGEISQEEMITTGVLMPAELTDPSLKSMLNYLTLQDDPLAVQAAALLKEALDEEASAVSL
jgi:hypothetical protein